MTDNAVGESIHQNQCSYALPSWRERFWRAVGFRYHHVEEPLLGAGADTLPGRLQTDMKFYFAWSDRLRLLLTGQLVVSSTVRFDTPSPRIWQARVDWRISPPDDA
jgi:hypothetical protein